jgi:effector-binding domain-containing protein/uncharacterized protein YndB with AHSA1/START domain
VIYKPKIEFMKALRVILIIVVVLVAAILIVPLFTPATAEVSSEIEMALKPADLFPTVASYTSRDKWDPWLTTDSTADATIEPKPGYVGSTYSWTGEKVGTGRMEVIAVVENQEIESSLWFGDSPTPSQIRWTFEPVDGGTKVVWSFSQETTYPFGRLGMMFGKIFLQKSFDLGLSNLKQMMESMPPKSSALGPITLEQMPAMFALVADGAGTMETIGEQLGELYGVLYAEAAKQQMEVSGAPFTDYLDFDEATGFSNYRAGVVVNKMGSDAGTVKAVAYPEMMVIQALHNGPYEDFATSYDELDTYIQTNSLDLAGNVFEFYIVGMMTEPDPSKWETRIAFPMK